MLFHHDPKDTSTLKKITVAGEVTNGTVIEIIISG